MGNSNEQKPQGSVRRRHFCLRHHDPAKIAQNSLGFVLIFIAVPLFFIIPNPIVQKDPAVFKD
jgi:hypothetical protein